VVRGFRLFPRPGLYWVGQWRSWSTPRLSAWLLPFAVVCAARPGWQLYTGVSAPRAGATDLDAPRDPRGLALAGRAYACGMAARFTCSAVFPWNAYGYALISPIWLAQGRSARRYLGSHLLACGGSMRHLPSLADERRRHQTGPWAGSRAGARPAIAALCRIYGAVRLERNPYQLRQGRAPFASCSPICSRIEKFNYSQKQQGDEPIYRAIGSSEAAPQSPRPCAG